jgi:glutamyl-tRNA synthetase
MSLHIEPQPAVGRLAPSPTGGLHVGHARTFLIAWLAARSAGGTVLLRIEDLDATRVRAWAVESAQEDLEWLGLDWEPGPLVQSERMTLYAEALERLKAAELIYPCTCTRAEIDRAASAPHAEDEGPTYLGTCSHRSSADAVTLSGRPFAWRFRTPAGSVRWDDLFLGPTRGDPARLGGDFVVARNGMGPSYQLAVVVDDALSGVTQVVRGDDLVASTPRQILLYRALGYPAPRFGHVPLAVGPDGRRLAKRDGSIKLETLREQKADPRRLIGLLARSCGWSTDVEPSSPVDWIARYDPLRIARSPWIVVLDELHP